MNRPPETTPVQRAGEARERLLARLPEDAAVVVPAAMEQPRNRDVEHPYRQDSDFFHLTGFPEPDAVAVLLPGDPGGAFSLFCRERDPSREQWTGRRAGPEGAQRDYGADRAWPIAEIDSRLPELLLDRETLIFPLGRHPDWDRRLTDWLQTARRVGRGTRRPPGRIELAEETLHRQRQIKTDAELACIRYAGAITAEAHRHAMSITRAGSSEYEIEAELLRTFHRARAAAAYPCIVAGGDSACILHYVDNDRPLHEGDLLLIDAGAEYDGYAADVTRTFPVSGRFTAEQRAVHDVVEAAHRASAEALRAGTTFDVFHETAVDALVDGLLSLGLLSGTREQCRKDGGWQRFFPHRTGHWLGMDVHDVGPSGGHGAWRTLEPGMVVTVEPGLYIPPDCDAVEARWRGIGVRIEDDYVVTASGAENLTPGIPRSADEIEAWMNP